MKCNFVDICNALRNVQFEMKASYFEIYNETIYDLLNYGDRLNMKQNPSYNPDIYIQVDENSLTSQDLTWVPVTTATELDRKNILFFHFLEILAKGKEAKSKSQILSSRCVHLFVIHLKTNCAKGRRER